MSQSKYHLKALLPQAIAAFLVALLALVAVSGCSKESREAAMEVATEKLELDHEDVFNLKPGMCFDEPNSEPVVDDKYDSVVDSIPVRECTEPHDNEAFYAYDLPDAPTYVVTEESEQQEYARCEQEFAGYVGISYDDSMYDFGIYTPTDESWALGDREILCFLYDPNGDKLTQPLKGTAK